MLLPPRRKVQASQIHMAQALTVYKEDLVNAPCDSIPLPFPRLRRLWLLLHRNEPPFSVASRLLAVQQAWYSHLQRTARRHHIFPRRCRPYLAAHENEINEQLPHAFNACCFTRRKQLCAGTPAHVPAPPGVSWRPRWLRARWVA